MARLIGKIRSKVEDSLRWDLERRISETSFFRQRGKYKEEINLFNDSEIKIRRFYFFHPFSERPENVIGNFTYEHYDENRELISSTFKTEPFIPLNSSGNGKEMSKKEAEEIALRSYKSENSLIEDILLDLEPTFIEEAVGIFENQIEL